MYVVLGVTVSWHRTGSNAVFFVRAERSQGRIRRDCLNFTMGWVRIRLIDRHDSIHLGHLTMTIELVPEVQYNHLLWYPISSTVDEHFVRRHLTCRRSKTGIDDLDVAVMALTGAGNFDGRIVQPWYSSLGLWNNPSVYRLDSWANEYHDVIGMCRTHPLFAITG